MVLRGIKCTLKAFILFLPRRKVLIEIEKAPEDFPRDGSRIEINRRTNPKNCEGNHQKNMAKQAQKPTTSYLSADGERRPE